MKKLFLFLYLFVCLSTLNAGGLTPCKNCDVSGTSIIRGTDTLQAGATLDVHLGSFVLADGQILFAKINAIAPDLAFPTTAVSALNIDWATSQTFSKTLAANSTFTFSNTKDGQTIVAALTNTTGNFTVTWPGTVKWSGGTAPPQTIGAKTDVYTFVQVGSVIYASVVQNF